MAIDVRSRLGISEEALAEFCRKWKIARLELFGSVLREDFRDESDVDLMVTFAADERWSLFDLVQMEQEMSELVGRPVDMPERTAVERSENYIRRRRILQSARTIYSANDC